MKEALEILGMFAINISVIAIVVFVLYKLVCKLIDC
jgi:hypothetical protein